MKMIPSNAIAAVASSALRNYKGNPISSVTRFMKDMNKQREKIKTNLNKSVIFLVVTLNSQDGSTGSTSANVHFLHLRVEEVGEILFGDLGRDAANVQSSRLP